MLYAALWVHELAGLRPASSFQFVLVVLSGLQRTLAKPKKKNESSTVEMLAALVQSADSSLADVWLMAMALPVFAAFFLCDELVILSYGAVMSSSIPRVCQLTYLVARQTSTEKGHPC